ncbi:MAG: hypothetical protein WKF36_09910 [Candidatus Nitrosocosmicus sp.]
MPGEIGWLNSIKTQLEKEVDEMMKMMDIYESLMMESGQETNG